jgi:hypothetical protein
MDASCVAVELTTATPGGSLEKRQLFIGVASPSSETWAATMRQPSEVRIQVWL